MLKFISNYMVEFTHVSSWSAIQFSEQNKSLNLYCVKYFRLCIPITIKLYKIHTFQFNCCMTEYTLLCTLRDQDTNVYIPIQTVSRLYSNSPLSRHR